MEDELAGRVQQEVAGLRRDTRDLRVSIDAFDSKIEQKADAATKAAIDRLEVGRKSNRRWARAALIAVLLLFAVVIGVVVFAVQSNGDRINDNAKATQERRVADCHSLDAIAMANIEGADRIVLNPAQRQAYADGMREAFDAVKASKGYSADCLTIGPPPTTGGK